MKYRKLPVVIEAFKLTNKNDAEQSRWILEAIERKEATVAYKNSYFVGMDIKTPEGTMRANDGDYIIKGINGEIYPCKPDIFEKTYEVADEAVPKNKDLETIKAIADEKVFSFEETAEITSEELNAIVYAAESMARELATLKDGYKVALEFCETMRKKNEFLKGLLGSRYPCNCEKFCVFKINDKCNHHGACDHRGELKAGESDLKANFPNIVYCFQCREWIKTDNLLQIGKCFFEETEGKFTEACFYCANGVREEGEPK